MSYLILCDIIFFNNVIKKDGSDIYPSNFVCNLILDISGFNTDGVITSDYEIMYGGLRYEAYITVMKIPNDFEEGKPFIGRMGRKVIFRAVCKKIIEFPDFPNP